MRDDSKRDKERLTQGSVQGPSELTPEELELIKNRGTSQGAGSENIFNVTKDSETQDSDKIEDIKSLEVVEHGRVRELTENDHVYIDNVVGADTSYDEDDIYDEFEEDYELIEEVEEDDDVDEDGIIYEDDDDLPEITTEEREEVKEQLRIIDEELLAEEKPPVLNARIREAYVNEEGRDELVSEVLERGEEVAINTILPSVKVETDLARISKALLNARLNNNAKAVKYYSELMEAMIQTVEDTGISDTFFNNEEADLEQGIYYEKDDKLLNTFSLKPKYRRNELNGKAALLRAMEALQIGEVVKVMLPHSGFWVTIDPPVEWEIVRFYNILYRDKINLGRNTLGQIFSAGSAKISNDFFMFIRKHIRGTSIKDFDKNRIGEILNINDLPILVWGMARAIYPQGFPYRRRCDGFNDVSEDSDVLRAACQHIESVNLSLDKLIFVDNNKISDRQKKIIGMLKSNAITLEQQREYVAEFDSINERVFEYKDAKFYIRQPTFNNYVQDALEWIDDINNEYDNALATGDYDEEGKRELLDSFVNSSIMRNWSHYVDKIEFISDGKEITDREAIRDVIGLYGADKTFSTKYVEEVVEFRNESIVAAIGIPEYKCPVCNREQKAEKGVPTLTNVIPLAPLNLFFLMLIIKFQILTISMEGN